MKTNVTILIDKNFNVYIPEIYGIDSWGSFYRQEYLEYNEEKKQWVFYTWQYGGEFEEDYRDETPLELLSEFNNDVKARKFLQGQGRTKAIEALDSLLIIYNEFKNAVAQK